MQPNTLYIHMTTSALFLAREKQNGETGFELARCEISPNSPFAIVLDKTLAINKDIQANTEKVRVIIDSPSILVPMAEFNEDTFRKYYDYCIPSDEKRYIFCDPLPAANAMLVFSVAENIYKTLEDRFDNLYFCCSMTNIVGYFIRKTTSMRSPKRLLLALREGAVDIIAVETGRLLSVNSFDVGAVSDVIYYTLSTAAKLGISVETDTFYVAGEDKLRESTISEMEKLARNVCEISPKEEFGELTTTMTEEVPFNLLTALC